jgi:integrase
VNIAKRPNGTWRARYYTPEGKQRAKHFRRKVDAERWLVDQKNRLNRGEWTAPELARITVDQWAPTWLASKSALKNRTEGSYESLWRTVVKPRWGSVRLDRITYGEVVNWVAELNAKGMSPSRVTQALLSLKQILDLAVLDGRLARNVAKPVKPPRARRAQPRFLSHDQVETLAEECGTHGDQYRLFVLVAAYCGLRWGEMRALRFRHLDLMRARIDVVEAVPERSTQVDTPKSHKARTVPIPRFLVDDLVMITAGRVPGDLVFTNSTGGMLDNTNFRRNVFSPAVCALGLEPFTPHDLRHTTASLAVSAGANVKAVQRLLGHASAAMTLDIYAALFDDDLDDVAHRLDVAHKRVRRSYSRDHLGTGTADSVLLGQATGV